MVNSYFLEGEKIGLRVLEKADLTEEYFQWLNDEKVTKYMEPGFFPNDSVSFKNYFESMRNSKNNVMFGIFWKKNEKHIGNVKLGPIHWIHRRADYSIIIGNKDYWKKGVCTEVTQLMCEYGFTKLNLNRIQLGVVDKNIGAIRAYEKLGFKEEGRSRNYFWADNSFHDNINMALLRDDFLRPLS